MGRAKMLPWQPGSFTTMRDEAAGRWVARSRYRDGAGKSVMIKRQGRTKWAAEQAVRLAIKEAEKNWGVANDLNAYSPLYLEHVAQELNGRPRKTLGWDTPAQRLRDLLIAS